MAKEKSKEIKIISLFSAENISLTSEQIKSATGYKEPSGTLRDLVHFGYLTKSDDNRNATYTRTSKKYDPKTRSGEKYVTNHEIIINKIFTGSFLSQNLGHELINFIRDDDGQRYVYLTPWGSRNENAPKETQYVFHIIESSMKDESGLFELAAVSKIDNEAKVYYSKDRSVEIKHSPKYYGKTFYEIFNCGAKTDLAHVYSFKASSFFVPAPNHRILIKIKAKEASISNESNLTRISLVCNPQHGITYAKASTSEQSGLSDLTVLHEIIDLNKGYLVESNSNITLKELDDEQCLSVICDRTNLEDSTSNQIAYFLNRDKNLNYAFLHNFLNINSVAKKEEFEIRREYKNIDLLFVGKNNLIVIENKIDTGIHDEQLKRYYELVNSEEELSEIPNKYFFVLAPEYNQICQRSNLDKEAGGEHYIPKTYNELFDVLKQFEYKPLGIKASPLGKALFKEFVKTIEYISWSKARQQERTAYIRLKQRMNELNLKSKTKK